MLDDLEIRRLLLATAARDAGAFETLYRRTAPLLLAVAQRILGRRELAEECLHDGFIRIWHAAERFDPLLPKPVAWLVAIVRNRAIDMASSAGATRVVSDSDLLELLGEADDPLGQAGDQLLETSERAHQVQDCLAALEAPQRQSLVLAYHHGMSHSELARHLDKPLGTVKSWVRRALANLRECVEHCMGGADEARRTP